MNWHLLHPAVVHFPLALVPVGLAGAVAARLWKGSPPWLDEAAAALLWLGTLAAWVSVALGLVAEETAPHVPMAWETLARHERLAFWTAGLLTAASMWRKFFPARHRGVFLAAWGAAAALLVATAYLGGELVFRHAVGVLR